jgi:hypothetical protein
MLCRSSSSADAVAGSGRGHPYGHRRRRGTVSSGVWRRGASTHKPMHAPGAQAVPGRVRRWGSSRDGFPGLPISRYALWRNGRVGSVNRARGYIRAGKAAGVTRMPASSGEDGESAHQPNSPAAVTRSGSRGRRRRTAVAPSRCGRPVGTARPCGPLIAAVAVNEAQERDAACPAFCEGKSSSRLPGRHH